MVAFRERLDTFPRWPDVAWCIIAVIAFTRGLAYIPLGGSSSRDLPAGVSRVFGDTYWLAGVAWLLVALMVAIGAARSSREELWYTGLIVMCFVWAGTFFVGMLSSPGGVAQYWVSFALYASLGSLFAVLTLAFDPPTVVVPQHRDRV